MKTKPRTFSAFLSSHRAQDKLATRSRILLVLPLLALLMAPPYSLSRPSHLADKSTSALPEKISRQQPNGVPKHVPPTTRTIYAPTVGLEGWGEAELILNNNSPKKMDVTPTFYTAEGNLIAGQKLKLKPAEVRNVAVSDLLPPGHSQNNMGGMSLTYFSGMLELGAQITLLRQNGGRSVDIPVSSMKDYQSPVQEAVWWRPNDGQATIILGNASNAPIRVTASSSTSQSQEIDIGPFATEILHQQSNGRNDSASSSNGLAESLRLEVSGPMGSLRATGLVTSADKSFTTGIRFYDPQTILQPHLFATNFQVKGTTPHLVLKNTLDVPISARPRFLPLSGESGNPFELLPVIVDAHQAAEVDLGPLMTTAATRPDLEMVGVQVVNESGLTGLIGALCTTNPITQTTYDVPLRDSGPINNSTGSYPWRVDGDYSTLISITNGGDKPAQFTVTINYQQKSYGLNPQQLAVGQTAVFDLKKIRDEQRPARDGYRISRSATVGQFRWAIHRGDGTGRLIGRSQVVSVSRQVSSTYSCPLCCPPSFFDVVLNPDSFTMEPNESGLVSVYGREDDCYGNISEPYSWTADSCSSDNSGVLTATEQGDHVQTYAWSEGQATVVVWANGLAYSFDGSVCAEYSISLTGDSTGTIRDVPKIRDLDVEYIDTVGPGEVPECGRFKIIIKYDISCPPPSSSIEVSGTINDRADFEGDNVTMLSQSDDTEVCTFRLEATYRMRNSLDQSVGTGDANFTVTITDGSSGKTASRQGPSVEVRATIPGTGPCP
jgi:hypothetical protein